VADEAVRRRPRGGNGGAAVLSTMTKTDPVYAGERRYGNARATFQGGCLPTAPATRPGPLYSAYASASRRRESVQSSSSKNVLPGRYRAASHSCGRRATREASIPDAAVGIGARELNAVSAQSPGCSVT
jgi:hypothetical protein